MKKTQFIELFNNIKKSIVSFVSVAFFVMLGTGMFLGIGWSEGAFKNTVDNTANEWNLHDMEVMFPYGFEEDYINTLKTRNDVDIVEGFYSTEAFFKRGLNRYQAKIISLTNNINSPSKIYGELPQKIDEIVIERYWAEKHNIQIGETITFEHNNEDKSHALKAIYDASLEELNNEENLKGQIKDLVSDTYTVTGFIETATYMNQYKVTYGVASKTSIPNDCLMYVLEDSFDKESFVGYPRIALSYNNLHKYSLYSSEYESSFDEYKDTIEKSIKDYTDQKNEKMIDGTIKIKDEANAKIKDGEKQIKDNEKKIVDGEKQIKDGRKELSEAKIQLEQAQKQLDEGKEELRAGENELNSAIAELNRAQETFDLTRNALNGYIVIKTKINEIKATINTIGTIYELVKEDILTAPDRYVLEEFYNFYTALNSGTYDDDINKMLVDYTTMIDRIKTNAEFESFEKIINDYEEYANTLPEGEIKTKFTTIIESLEYVLTETNDILDLPNELFESYKILRQFGLDDIFANQIINELNEMFISEGYNDFLNIVDTIADIISIEFNNFQELASEIYNLLDLFSPAIVDTITPILDGYTTQLDDAWQQIESAKAQLNSARKEIEDGQEQIDEGWIEYNKNVELLDSKQQEIVNGKKQIEEAKVELEQAKKDFVKLKDSLKEIKKYDYSILGRSSNGGIASTIIPSKIMGNLKYTMALLFVIVGIFVCYSALSRIVFEQTVQIGTKKALGLNDREITIFYLAYAFIAVSIGSVLGTLLARFIIEPIIVNILAKNYIVGKLIYYFDIKTTILFYLFELFTSLIATYLACKNILKQKATKLLAGQNQVLGKQRFYEKTKLWDKLPLFTKTIINNCFNDPRRVFATLVGVAGCCSLMVCAIVIKTNMDDSFEYQMNKITKFDTMVYFDSNNGNAMDNVSEVLIENNIDFAPSLYSTYTLKSPENSYLSSAFIAFNDESALNYFDAINEGVRVNTNDGICVSKAYANYYNLKLGDNLCFLDGTGKEHEVPISGIIDFYLLRGQMMMSSQAFEKEFNELPKENTLIFKRGDYSIDELYELLDKTDGFVSIFDYATEASQMYSSLTSALSIIIITFFALSVVLAFLVLLNLLVMFVDEKRRELIVLMINGFDRKDAKKYIYEDTIFLTIIGIVLGCILGAVVGIATLKTFDSDCVTIMRNINIPSYILCGLFTSLLSIATCLMALRKISKFKLTDINKA